uniref:Uncharacterized protein n=1 Tax=Strigamia maritima TaxID=126957 RepID=T1J2R9_STRMM
MAGIDLASGVSSDNGWLRENKSALFGWKNAVLITPMRHWGKISVDCRTGLVISLPGPLLNIRAPIDLLAKCEMNRYQRLHQLKLTNQHFNSDIFIHPDTKILHHLHMFQESVELLFDKIGNFCKNLLQYDENINIPSQSIVKLMRHIPQIQRLDLQVICTEQILVEIGVRDANGGAGVNPNQLFQHIRQYHRVPIKDKPLKKHIATWLAKALGCGFVRRLVGGRYQFVTASRRQARHNQMTTSFTRLSVSRPTLVVRPSLLTRQALNRACLVSRKLSKVNMVKMNRPMKNVDFLRRGVKFVKEKEKERVSSYAEIPALKDVFKKNVKLSVNSQMLDFQ